MGSLTLDLSVTMKKEKLWTKHGWIEKKLLSIHKKYLIMLLRN